MGKHGVSLENMGNMATWRKWRIWKRWNRWKSWLKSHQKTSEGEKQAYFCLCLNKDIHCMFVEGTPRTVFFLQTLCLRHLLRRLKTWWHTRLENLILGQLRIGEHQMTSAALFGIWTITCYALGAIKHPETLLLWFMIYEIGIGIIHKKWLPKENQYPLLMWTENTHQEFPPHFCIGLYVYVT